MSAGHSGNLVGCHICHVRNRSLRAIEDTVEALARVCCCRVDEMRAPVADVMESNGMVTLVNGKTRREYENRVVRPADSHCKCQIQVNSPNVPGFFNSCGLGNE
jgi:hypothetical protein